MHLVAAERQPPARADGHVDRPERAISGPVFVPVSASADDGLLGEIELVMQVRIATELRALDDFTPLADQR